MTRKIHLIGIPGTKVLMRVGRELAPPEYEAYEQDLAYLLEYEHSRELRPIVEKNAAEALRVLEAACTVSFESMRDVAKRRAATIEANRVVLNFLSAMRLFDDHMQTRLTRRFGSGSEIVSAYRRIKGQVHDKSQAYRVLYAMRNYVQHCGMPIREIAVRTSTAEGETIAFECHSQDLLDRFSGWKHAQQDLVALSPSFRIAPLKEQVVVDIREIADDVRVAESDDVRSAASRVYSMILEAAGPDPQGAVVEMITDLVADKSHFRFMIPPPGLFADLGFNARRIGRI
jgi:hypothetical protein